MSNGYLPDVTPETLAVFVSTVVERRRQDRKFGVQDHDFGSWLEILMEEVGEACRARMEARYRPGPEGGFVAAGRASLQEQKAHIRTELVEATAVLVAMIECGDRQKWFGDE